MFNSLKGWKTFIANMAVLVAGAAEWVGVNVPLIPEEGGVAMIALAVVNLVLRFMTESPIFNKDK